MRRRSAALVRYGFRARPWRLRWVLAAVNVLTLVAILATKPPQYEWLWEADTKFWANGSFEWSSADPMYLAARPFDSPSHVSDVPVFETIYFTLNTPAMLAALSVADPIAQMTSEWWTTSPRTSSAWSSWTLAAVFGLFCTLWAFTLGAIGDWLRPSSRPLVNPAGTLN